MFYTEIQDGRQKMAGNVLSMLPRNLRWPTKMSGKQFLAEVASRFQNFVEIALSCTVIKINAFLHFTQKFKTSAKNGRENYFCENAPVHPVDTCYTQKFKMVNNFVEIALSHTVSEILKIFHFQH